MRSVSLVAAAVSAASLSAHVALGAPPAPPLSRVPAAAPAQAATAQRPQLLRRSPRPPLLPIAFADTEAGAPNANRTPGATKEPELPVPALKLTVVAPSARGEWTMHLQNMDAVPIRIVADARLLTLDVTSHSDDEDKSPVVHCAPPRRDASRGDEERGLVIPPHRAYAERFDPRLYCFGAREADALVPGASVVARLGWARGRGPKAPPYIVSAIDGVEPKLGPEKEITSEAFLVGPERVGRSARALQPEARPAAPAPRPDQPAGDAPPSSPSRCRRASMSHGRSTSRSRSS